MTERLEGLDAEDLRALVREVLRDALPSGPLPVVGHAPREDPAAGVQEPQWVVLETDEDLTALVRRVAEECEDPAVRADLRAGRVPYRLAPRPQPPAPPEPSPQAPALRVERGAVTERHVRDAAGSGCRLVLGRAAVLTPLARDRARSMGVDVEKER